MNEYRLDEHCTQILEDFGQRLPVLEKIKEIVVNTLRDSLKSAGLELDGLEARVKTEKSLAGKLERKGHKYHSISDITDLVGVRIITFYTDDVDKASSIVDNDFDVDWEASVDKRKSHELNSFGYNSLHYICSIPKSLYFDPQHPEINNIRFEIQMRTCLQHVWASIEHDIGYKGDGALTREHYRNLRRLAGMLELADEQFSAIRTEINNYRRDMCAIAEGGDISKVALTEDNFARYLETEPFDKLIKRIAAVNQAEIIEVPCDKYFKILKQLGFNNLGQIDKLYKQHGEDAYTLASHLLGSTDHDIVASSIALQTLCCIHVLRNGGGLKEIKQLFDNIDAASEHNEDLAATIIEFSQAIDFDK